MMDELKPCPFCGSKRQRMYVNPTFESRIECMGCPAKVTYDRDDAIGLTTVAAIADHLVKGWNIRYTMDEFEEEEE